MNKTLVNQLAQLFVFGVRAIVAADNDEGSLGRASDHLHLLQTQLDSILDNDGCRPGHVVKSDEELRYHGQR